MKAILLISALLVASAMANSCTKKCYNQYQQHHSYSKYIKCWYHCYEEDNNLEELVRDVGETDSCTGNCVSQYYKDYNYSKYYKCLKHCYDETDSYCTNKCLSQYYKDYNYSKYVKCYYSCYQEDINTKAVIQDVGEVDYNYYNCKSCTSKCVNQYYKDYKWSKYVNCYYTCYFGSDCYTGSNGSCKKKCVIQYYKDYNYSKYYKCYYACYDAETEDNEEVAQVTESEAESCHYKCKYSHYKYKCYYSCHQEESEYSFTALLAVCFVAVVSFAIYKKKQQKKEVLIEEGRYETL